MVIFLNFKVFTLKAPVDSYHFLLDLILRPKFHFSTLLYPSLCLISGCRRNLCWNFLYSIFLPRRTQFLTIKLLYLGCCYCWIFFGLEGLGYRDFSIVLGLLHLLPLSFSLGPIILLHMTWDNCWATADCFLLYAYNCFSNAIQLRQVILTNCSLEICWSRRWEVNWLFQTPANLVYNLSFKLPSDILGMKQLPSEMFWTSPLDIPCKKCANTLLSPDLETLRSRWNNSNVLKFVMVRPSHVLLPMTFLKNKNSKI